MLFGSKTTITLKVEGMSCKHCVASVQKALEAVDGVKKALVDLEGKSATVTAKASVKREDLIAAVEDAGFKAE